MVRGRTKKAPGKVEPEGIDANQVVSYNFRRARELRGWTQEQTALRLEAFLGTRPPQAAISSIERCYEGVSRREFDAQELVVFALAFDVPILWFFLPPPDDRRRLRQTSKQVDELFTYALGTASQVGVLHERLAELGMPEPDEDDARWEALTGAPTAASRDSYDTRRKEAILAMLDSRTDRLDRAADELGKFFDHLRQVGIRGLVFENTGDRDYATGPENRRKPRS